MPPATYPGPSSRLDSVKQGGGGRPDPSVGAAPANKMIAFVERRNGRSAQPLCAPARRRLLRVRHTHLGCGLGVGCWLPSVLPVSRPARNLWVALGSFGYRWVAQLARFQHAQHLPPSSSRTALLRSSSLVCLSPFSCSPRARRLIFLFLFPSSVGGGSRRSLADGELGSRAQGAPFLATTN